MSNADAVRSTIEALKVRQCKVALCISEQDEETRALFDEIMWATAGTAGRPTSYQIAQALRSLGYEVSDATMDRHRRKTCICFSYTKQVSK